MHKITTKPIALTSPADPDPGWKKFGSGINIPDPQHWHLHESDLGNRLIHILKVNPVNNELAFANQETKKITVLVKKNGKNIGMILMRLSV